MRGVTPIVSTLLLILVGIASVLILYYFLSDLISSQQASIEEEVSKGQDQIILQTLSSWNTSTGTIKAYIYNAGDTDFTLSAAYVLTTTNSVVCGPEDLNTDLTTVTINPGDVRSVLIDYNEAECNLPSGRMYRLKVVTEGGGIAYGIFETG